MAASLTTKFMANDSLHLIQERRKALQMRREELTSALAQIQAEESELAVAERVLSRLGSVRPQTRVGNVDVQIRTVQDSIPKKGTKRPPNVPTTRTMLETVLIEAEKAGKVGLPPKEMVLEIQRRWWPGIGWNSVMPDAARLVNNGVLARSNGLYVRGRQSKGPNAEASGPDVPPGNGGSSPLFQQTAMAATHHR
jgi:hypothetical protein